MNNLNHFPLVSICIPIYGVEKYIEKCARSVFEQTYENIEYIFVNDCTKDGSMDILETVIDEYPNRKINARIINHDKNKGLAGARNTAVEHAQGDFLLWVDSDDYIDVTTVQKLICKQLKNNADIVVSDVYRCYPGYREYVSLKSVSDPKEYLHKVLRDETEHWLSGKLLRKRLYTDYNIKAREGSNMGEDFQVYPQLVNYANRIDYIEEPFYYYMFYNTNSYGHTISESIQYQRWMSFEVLEQFFKNTEYTKDLDYQKLQMIYFQFKTYVMCDGLSNTYYQMLWNKIQEVSPVTLQGYPLFKKIMIYPLLNAANKKYLGHSKKILMSLYARIINAANYTKRNLKSHIG